MIKGADANDPAANDDCTRVRFHETILPEKERHTIGAGWNHRAAGARTKRIDAPCYWKDYDFPILPARAFCHWVQSTGSLVTTVRSAGVNLSINRIRF